MSEPKTELAQRMVPDTSEVRLNRMWGRISSRRSARGRWLWGAFAAGAAAFATALVLMVVRPAAAPLLHEGSQLAARGAADVVGRMDDGSRVELAADGAVEVARIEPELTQIRLSSGRAVFDVAKKPKRRFEVLADDVTVRVLGTRFSVALEGNGVAVAVERGIVEVRRGDEVVQLTVGQRWPATTVTQAGAESELETAEADAVADATPHSPKAIRHKKRVAAKTRAPKVQDPEVPAVGGSPVTVEPQKPPEPTAAELFGSALEARRAGRIDEASQSLKKLLEQFPDDARAGLAAFELGRLEMDARRNLPAAARSLERSLELSAGGEFREEALSRLIRAYDELHRTDECARRKAEYLSRYPQGSYLQSITGRCAPK